MRRAAAGHCGTDGRILPRAEEATALLHVGMAILPTATRSEEAIATKAEPLYVAKEHVLEPLSQLLLTQMRHAKGSFHIK